MNRTPVDLPIYPNLKMLETSLFPKGPPARRAAEIGLGVVPENVNCRHHYARGIPCLFVDPNPASWEAVRSRFPKAQFVNVALCDEPKELTLRVVQGTPFFQGCGFSAGSSWVESYDHPGHDVPAIREGLDSVTSTLKVQGVTFDTIDPGDIDVMSLDVEGAEWSVLKHMISRPRMIFVELRWRMGWKNTFLDEILEWFRGNGYHLHGHNGVDDLWVLNGD